VSSLAEESESMSSQRIEADYLIETAFDPMDAAQVMAGEQSSGTFIAIPGESAELKARSAARIDHLEQIGETQSPSLPGAAWPKGSGHAPLHLAKVTLSWPDANVNGSLPNLLATVAGNLFELQQFSGLRLLDIRLTDAFAARYAGPRFGVAGTRQFSGVANGPLIGTIIKPSIGLSAEETAALVQQLCVAGIDFIKDDELLADAAFCRFEDRVKAVMRVIRNHAMKTGKSVMFAFNITGELDEMRHRHDLVLREGGTCIMASLNSVGLVGMLELARHTQVPLHAHRNGWGYLTRHPRLGWDFQAWHKIWRLAGVDHMHVNGIGNKFSEDDATVLRSARACTMPVFANKAYAVMPVFSSGQTIRQVSATYQALGHTDLIYAAGGGIMAHPGGAASGVRSLRDAWEGAIAGRSLEQSARGNSALQQAMDIFK
jgi:ribulose-bisphosphate carboxylase large chain